MCISVRAQTIKKIIHLTTKVYYNTDIKILLIKIKANFIKSPKKLETLLSKYFIYNHFGITNLFVSNMTRYLFNVGCVSNYILNYYSS